jgi:nitroimidazol reductase NimA-like FMN-containing flavoprotein (pyridoxamine 5'-phosphate oxidase superfamily)
MRRSDREITDFEEQVKVIEKCDVCRLAFHDTDFPYILPLNFGMDLENGHVVLYFHGAKEGYKYELMKRDNRVSFEMDCGHQLHTTIEEGNCTMEYESIIGHGKIEMVSDEDKYKALCLIMAHYRQPDFPFNKKVMPQTTVFRLMVSDMTGKKRKVTK